MRNKDYEIFANNNFYAVIESKTNYLINKYGFIKHPNNEKMLVKNDLVIMIDMLYNYSREKLDVLEFLAHNNFVNDPFFIKGFINEFVQMSYDDVHNYEYCELIEMYRYAREQFYADKKLTEVTI